MFQLSSEDEAPRQDLEIVVIPGVVMGSLVPSNVPPCFGERKMAACLWSSFQGASSFVVVDSVSVVPGGASGRLIESVDEYENIKLLLAPLLEVVLDIKNGCLLGVEPAQLR